MNMEFSSNINNVRLKFRFTHGKVLHAINFGLVDVILQVRALENIRKQKLDLKMNKQGYQNLTTTKRLKDY